MNQTAVRAMMKNQGPELYYILADVMGDDASSRDPEPSHLDSYRSILVFEAVHA